MTDRVKLGLMLLNRMPISKDIRNMILKFLFIDHRKKLNQYIKSCSTSVNMQETYNLHPTKFQFHRYHEVTGKAISKIITFCQYCGNYCNESATGRSVQNACLGSCHLVSIRTYYGNINPSAALVLKYLKMNLDENHQHIRFVRKRNAYDEGPLFTPFDPTEDDYFRVDGYRWHIFYTF